jgi:hypothetical protein
MSDRAVMTLKLWLELHPPNDALTILGQPRQLMGEEFKEGPLAVSD